MIIVLEGVDGGGKTTLAKQLEEEYGIDFQPSEGPEKYPGEINHRIRNYNSRYPAHIVFDRHPTVSHIMYGGKTPIDGHLLRWFHGQRPLFVHVAPPAEKHIVAQQVHDTPELMSWIEDNYTRLVANYHLWSKLTAAFTYDRTNYDLLTRYLAESR